MNSCEKYEELISRLIDEDLTDEESSQLQQHMAECEECRKLYDYMFGISEAMDESLEELPEGLHENIMAQVNRAATIQKNRVRTSKIIRLVTGTAAVAVLVAGVVLATGAGRMGSSQSSMAADARISASPQLAEEAMGEEAPAEIETFPAEAPAEFDAAMEPEAPYTMVDQADTNTGAPAQVTGESLRSFLGGEAYEGDPGEPVQLLTLEDGQFAFYELDGMLLYRDPADGQIYRSDKDVSQLREFIQG